MRMMLNLTASELNGVPSWNLTPGLSLKVQVLRSGVLSQLVASCGTGSILVLKVTRLSKIARIGWPNGPVPTGGSRLFGSVPSTMVNGFPPPAAWAGAAAPGGLVGAAAAAGEDAGAAGAAGLAGAGGADGAQAAAATPANSTRNPRRLIGRSRIVNEPPIVDGQGIAPS